MARRLPLGLIAALSLALVASAAPGATVSGRVLDSAGAPVAGAKVIWESFRTDEQVAIDETKGAPPSPLGEATTDAGGRFRITLDKPAVEVSIRISPGTLPGALLGGPFDSSEDVTLDDVELPASEKISGRVSDEGGKPVARARVRTTRGLSFDEDDVIFYSEATTAADGSYSIPNAAATGGGVSVRAPGYSPSRQASIQRRTVINVTLKKGGTIRGTVVDLAGKAADGAAVLTGSLAVRADAAGAYLLSGVSAGSVDLVAFGKDDLAARKDTVRVKKGDTVEVPLRLAKAASVTGSVIDERTRRPLAGARISASTASFGFGDETRSRRARTDAKGRFRIAGLASRRYTVRAAKTDYLPVSMPGIVAVVAQPANVAIALQKASAIAGRVTDESGAPVPGARVRIARDTNVRALMRGGPSAFLGRPGVTSGPDGTFRLRGLSAEKNVTLEAAKTGYATAKRHGVTVKPGETVKDVALILKRGLEARGRVVDAAGQPIPGAEVRLSQSERGGARFVFQMAGMNRDQADATSGTDGSFRVAGLEAGEYALAVSREGYATKRVPSVAVQAPGPSEWPAVVLTAGVPIAGLVRNSKGEAVVGADVFAFGDGAGPRNARTDLEGRFRLEGFSADRPVMVNVRADGYASLQKRLTPSPGEVVLVVKTSSTIRGRVEDAETKRPVTDFTATYTESQGGIAGGFRMVMAGGESEKAFQSTDGSFELADVPPGKWIVRASSLGYRPAEVSGIEVGEGETKEGVVVSLKKGGVVTGRVLDPRRGTGVANASVTWSEGSSAGMGPGMAALARLDGGTQPAVTTDADGRFRFDGLPSGKITLSAEHPEFLETSKQVDLEDEASVDLTLSLGGSIAGTVVGKDGRSGVPGAQVLLRQQGSGMNFGDDSSRADASGNFAFEHLKAGRYSVSAQSNAGTTAWKDVVLGESQRQDGVLLEMAAGATIQGTVSGLPSANVAGVRIFASSKDYQDGAVTGDDGRFTLRDVPSGVLRLQASTAFPSMRSTSKNLDVPEGAAEVPVEIVFEGTSRLSGRVTRGEKPISNAFVSATPDPPTAAGGRASDQTDEAGRYSIEGLSDGNYLVQVSGQGVRHRNSFAVSGDTTADIDVPMITISGVVTDSGSNDPLEGASVQAESGTETGPYAIKRAVTDSRGFYSIESVDLGNYQLTARKEGYQLKAQPVSVSGSPVELNLSLVRGSGLAIRAVDGLSGLPLRWLVVLTYSSSGAVAFSGGVPLDAEGRGEIPSLTPGQYSVSLGSEGYARRSFTVQIPSGTLAVTLTPGGRVEIRTNVAVTARMVDATGALYVGLSRRDGIFSLGPPASVLEHIAPGSYRLIVTGPSRESSYPFAVSEGQTTTVELR
ncbi:MAG TPA: carboxypeptidase regulatory-like domain-containing protein [Thermoanaerobaculia bacterium]|jgi:protocatechuate 3,4-dioxygenase beta subunit|nr:carboxypeptidase regulatory-like domain-containing protein [Thermoanaerobaculia bacterium]HEV8610290.1 carboxypeptidase regulatory-like domain-containing protein [Thermoanaerobaculia bacterium]